MGECKAKAIQTNLGTFSRNLTYPGIIQAYLELCVTLTYLKLWYIQNPDIFRTRSIFKNPGIFTILVNSEPRYSQNSGILKI